MVRDVADGNEEKSSIWSADSLLMRKGGKCDLVLRAHLPWSWTVVGRGRVLGFGSH